MVAASNHQSTFQIELWKGVKLPNSFEFVNN